MKNSPDQAILERARRFDAGALEEIFNTFSPGIYRYAYRLLGDEDLAQECMSETFSRFLVALKHENGPDTYLQAYIYRIAHNWITDQYRREHPTEELPESLLGETTTLEETTDRNIQYTRLLQAIRRLTPNQQQVIVLKFWQDCENVEIAHTLGKPVSAIKSLQHRALLSLQRHMKVPGKYEEN